MGPQFCQEEGMQEGMPPEEQALAEEGAMNGAMIPEGEIVPTEEAQLPPTLPIQ